MRITKLIIILLLVGGAWAQTYTHPVFGYTPLDTWGNLGGDSLFLNVSGADTALITSSGDSVVIDTDGDGTVLVVESISIEKISADTVEITELWSIDGADTSYWSSDSAFNAKAVITTLNGTDISATSAAADSADIARAYAEWATVESLYVNGVTDIEGTVTIEAATVETLNVDGVLDVDCKFNDDWTASGGASVGNLYKTTLGAGETFTVTTGHQFKMYDADKTVIHSGGEHTCVYASMKLLSSMLAGGKSVLYSGHNYADTIAIDAGMWLYGGFEDAWKVSGGTIGTGLDLSETIVSDQDIEFSGGATARNTTDSLVFTETNVAVYGSFSATTIDTLAYFNDVDSATYADTAVFAVNADTATVFSGFFAGTDTIAGGAGAVTPIYVEGIDAMASVVWQWRDTSPPPMAINVRVVDDSLVLQPDSPADSSVYIGKVFSWIAKNR